MHRGLEIVAVLVAVLAIAPFVGLPPNLVFAERSPECSIVRSLADWRSRWLARKHFAGVHEIESDSDFALWNTPVGRFWAPKTTMASIPNIAIEISTGLYGHPPCNGGDVVIDCGAHIGMYTRSVLDHGASLVLAVEPSPRNIASLRRNFASEIAAGRVLIIEKGVWNTVGQLSFGTADDSSLDRVDNGGGPSISIPVTTIDQIVRDYKLARIDVIKMDIEGAERNALEGARDTLSRLHPRLRLAAYHRAGDPEAFRSLAPGYRMDCRLCLAHPEQTPAQIAPTVAFMEWSGRRTSRIPEPWSLAR